MCRDRFVRLGRYCRTKPFVFSFVPRSQGLPGRAKKIPSEVGREFMMAGHLGALVPGEAAACAFWQRAEGGDEGVTHLAGRVPLQQRDQTEIAGASVDERGDGGLAAGAHDEVALPVAEPLAQLDDRWPTVDEDSGRNESGHALIGAAALLSQRSAGAKFPGQGPAQATLGTLVEGSVDGFVTEVPLGTVGPAGPEMGGDLFRAPLHVQLGLNLCFELGRAMLKTCGSASGWTRRAYLPE